MESPNLEFEYGDTDTLTAELSGKTTDRHPLAWTLYSKPFDHRCAFVAIFEWQVRSFTHQKWSTAIWMVSTTQQAILLVKRFQ